MGMKVPTPCDKCARKDICERSNGCVEFTRWFKNYWHKLRQKYMKDGDTDA